MAKERLISIVDVHVIFESEQEGWLFSRRSNTGYKDGEFSFVAGHLEQGESVEECAIREAREEAGVTIDPKDLTLVHVLRRDAEKNRISFFFICRNWQGEIINLETDKCSELTWFTYNNIPAQTVDYIEYASREIIRNVLLGDFKLN